jgi:hypothetical protein
MAVAALEHHWNDPQFYRAVIGGLCILAAQVDGMRSVADTSNIESFLDEEQSAFLSAVISALVERYDGAPAGLANPAGDLPPGNPVTLYLHERLCLAFRC